MGLDMYLSAEKYVGGYDHSGPEERCKFDKITTAIGLEGFRCEDSPSLTVSVNVAYWRKANAIHQWFVKNVQNGKDERQRSYVEREQMEELVKICQFVLDRPGNAADVLPTQAGFFFGSTTYDEYYLKNLRDTIQKLRTILDDKRLEEFDFYYRSSW